MLAWFHKDPRWEVHEAAKSRLAESPEMGVLLYHSHCVRAASRGTNAPVHCCGFACGPKEFVPCLGRTRGRMRRHVCLGADTHVNLWAKGTVHCNGWKQKLRVEGLWPRARGVHYKRHSKTALLDAEQRRQDSSLQEEKISECKSPPLIL